MATSDCVALLLCYLNLRYKLILHGRGEEGGENITLLMASQTCVKHAVANAQRKLHSILKKKIINK